MYTNSEIDWTLFQLFKIKLVTFFWDTLYIIIIIIIIIVIIVVVVINVSLYLLKYTKTGALLPVYNLLF